MLHYDTSLVDYTNTNQKHHASQMSISSYIARELKKVDGPMQVIAGTPPTGTREGVPLPRPIGDDPELLKLTKHVRRPGEKFINQFIARTGLSPLQIRSLSPTELAKRVATADENNAASGLTFADPMPATRRLTITL